MDWFTIIICFGIGFIIGRFYPRLNKAYKIITAKDKRELDDIKI